MKFNKKFLLSILLTLIFSSCEVGPNYHSPNVETPTQWKGVNNESYEEMISCNWWEVFNDSLLNQLIYEAIENNYDLKASIERVVQARSLAGIAKADLYPQIGFAPAYTNQIVLTEAFLNAIQNTGAPNPLFRQHYMAYMLPLNLNWEIDLWGKLRNIYKSAVYNAEAQYENFRALLLVLTTDLAENYFAVRNIDRLIDLYKETIVTRKKALDINKSRYDSKLATYQPVAQALLDLYTVEAEYQEALRQRTRLENQIAVLIGKPASEFSLDHNPLKEEPPEIPAGIPSDVLLQRPDLLALERQRASTHALIRSAYANFLPSFNLTGAVGFSSPDLRQFLSWKSRMWQVGASGYQFVIDGGRNLSNLDLQWARFKEADENYQQLVLTIFQEVEDALIDIEKFAIQAKDLKIASTAATSAYKIAFDRYYQGVTFYLEVMDSERDQLTAERSYNAALGNRYTATIQLIKSLGGSWANTNTSNCK